MWTKNLYRFLCLLPWVWLATFWLFVIRARFRLERWPEPYRPDPKDLGYSDHAMAIYTLFLGVIVGLLLWAAMSVKLRPDYAKGWLPLYLVGFGMVIIMVVVDPGNFLEWFLD